MFVARGTGEDPGLGETGKITRDIADAIPGSTAYAINYPASFLEVNYFLSVSNGTEMLQESIGRYAQTCPGHKMALFGYSQGAQITSNNICGQPHVWSLAGASLDDSSLPKNLTKDSECCDPTASVACLISTVVSVVLFGDPTHNENSAYNYGSGEESGVSLICPEGKALVLNLRRYSTATQKTTLVSISAPASDLTATPETYSAMLVPEPTKRCTCPMWISTKMRWSSSWSSVTGSALMTADHRMLQARRVRTLKELLMSSDIYQP